MTKDEITNKFLDELREVRVMSDGYALLYEILGSKDYERADEIIDYAKHKGLLRRAERDRKCVTIEPFGIEVVDSGGWLKNIAAKAKKETEIQLIEAVRYKKDFNQGTIAKWQKWTFWPITIVALIGGILGALAFFGIHLS